MTATEATGVFHVKHHNGAAAPPRVCAHVWYAPAMRDTTSRSKQGLRAMGISAARRSTSPRAPPRAGRRGELAVQSHDDPRGGVRPAARARLGCGTPLPTEGAPGGFRRPGERAGFPGIPLAILSSRPVTLVESVKKKAAFLERVVAELRLEASVQGIRAEELAEMRPRSYSAVTARALSSLPSLVELASPLLAEGGPPHLPERRARGGRARSRAIAAARRAG